MKAEYLLVDVSNSFVKWSPASRARIGPVQRIATSRITLRALREIRKQHTEAKVMIASVVPNALHQFQKVWPSSQLHAVNSKSPLGIGIKYPHPQTIGADRLANAVAAAHLYSAPAIVVDFGTAVTFDIISQERKYIGGVIAPGLEAMTNYLHERTALLPNLDLREPRATIAKSTTEAMRVGAVIGYRGMIKEILGELKEELGVSEIHTVATGGYSKLISKKLPQIHTVNPLLTLQGLHFIAHRSFS